MSSCCPSIYIYGPRDSSLPRRAYFYHENDPDRDRTKTVEVSPDLRTKGTTEIYLSSMNGILAVYLV